MARRADTPPNTLIRPGDLIRVPLHGRAFWKARLLRRPTYTLRQAGFSDFITHMIQRRLLEQLKRDIRNGP